MDKPADPVAVVNAADVQSPDRKAVRRRLVQSTLFPLKSHEAKFANSVNQDAEKVEEIVDDEEEYCGSQGRSRRKGNKKGAKKVEVVVDGNDDDEEFCGSQERSRKGKKSKRNATPQKRSSKKVAVDGKDASIIAVDDIESPDDGGPQQLKAKQRGSARNGRTYGKKGSSPAKGLTHPLDSHQASQPVPNLWLEAKKTAEENSRLFSGKQMHPFFSAWKAGRKDQETTEVENNGCLHRRERHEFRPIHVFENVQAEIGSIDWSNWTLCEGTFGKATCDQERVISSLESTVGSSNFGTDLNISKPSRLSLRLEDLSMGQHDGAHEDASVITTFDSHLVIDEEVTPYDLLKNMEKDFEMNKLGFMSGNFDEKQKANLLESIMSYYLNRGNHPENSLWTNKYQPEKALEVCGNGEAVKFINKWLHLWHSADFRVSRKSYSANKCSMGEDDSDSYDNDSDMENLDEASGLKNVLLVTGPVGSGKSAAIYACAKEQGFHVIEVNASDWRNGAVLKQKFGEAVGSHWLKRSQEIPLGSPNKLHLKPSPNACTNKAAALDLNKSVVEMVSLSEDDSVDGMQCGSDGRTPSDQSEIKTVILFEDVDATLCEDRGFISTIQQLADTGKRPMILTSNSENPVLPDSLAREEVCFTMPSLQELIDHIYLVCATEKANVQPCLIERCLHFCGGDIRKTLTHLQFWCQSKGFVTDRKLRTMYSPLMFNLEAGHCVLPKLIPWELPSSLSLFIEAEIAKTFCKKSTEENDSLLKVIEEEVGNSQENNLDFEKGEMASIEAKKEAILRGNCFQHVDNDIIAVSNMCDFFSDSPVAFARRNVRRKLGTVLSDSDDEIPAVSGGLGGGDINSSVPADEFFAIPCPAMNDTRNLLVNHLVQTGTMEEVKLPSGTADLNKIHFSPVGNSHKSTGQCVRYKEPCFADIQEQRIELGCLNYNSMDAADNSLNLLADPLPHPVLSKSEANRNLFPIVGEVNQNSPAISNLKNQSTDEAVHFMETNAMETESGNLGHCREDTSNYCVNPLIGYGESKMAAKRCLFPQTLLVDPINCTADGPLNQSAHQPINHGNQEAALCSGNPFSAEFLSHGEANLEDVKRNHPEIANLNLYGSRAVNDSLNLSFNQFFHSVEDKELEFQNQCPGTGTTSHINCASFSNPPSPSSCQFLGIAFQNQYPGSAGVMHVGCPPEDCSWKPMTHLSLFKEDKMESLKYQFPETPVVNAVRCPIVGNTMNPENDKLFHFGEEHQSQYSDATNLNHVNDGCQSLDMSCVPESTFVPETEVDGGMEFPSGDLMEIVSPVTADIIDPSVKHKTSGHIRCRDINLNVSNEELGDSQNENEHLEVSTSGCQVMDECSRMDFCKRSKSYRSSKLAARNPVQEKWNELRQMDLRQHFTSEHEHACQILELAYGMSNLISEADLLLYPSRFVTNDSLHQDKCLGEETLSFGWHDQQVEMACAIAEHGYSLYAKSVDFLRLKMGIDKKMDLAWELLASTSDSMALGKLLRMGRSEIPSFLAEASLRRPTDNVPLKSCREREICLQNMVLSIVPLRSHLALRGSALHDYLSSLTHISSSEASRLAVAAEKRKGRRVRVAKNYLNSGGLDLSSEDISLLNMYKSYRKG